MRVSRVSLARFRWVPARERVQIRDDWFPRNQANRLLVSDRPRLSPFAAADCLARRHVAPLSLERTGMDDHPSLQYPNQSSRSCLASYLASTGEQPLWYAASCRNLSEKLGAGAEGVHPTPKCTGLKLSGWDPYLRGRDGTNQEEPSPLPLWAPGATPRGVTSRPFLQHSHLFLTLLPRQGRAGNLNEQTSPKLSLLKPKPRGR